MSSAPASPGPDPESRNDLHADSYVWFRSTDRRTARSLLAVLEENGIAAYFAADAEDPGLDTAVADPDTVHIFIDSTETAQAHSVGEGLSSATAMANSPSGGEPATGPAQQRRELDAAEVDARFAELIAQFDQPSRSAIDDDRTSGLAVDEDPTKQDDAPLTEPPTIDSPPSDSPPSELPTDNPPPATPFRPSTSDFLAESDEDEHYTPPPPEPMKPLSRRSFTALTILAIGCVLLFFPGLLGFSGTPIAVTGVVLITGGVGLLLLQLRDGPDDPTDDGARL